MIDTSLPYGSSSARSVNVMMSPHQIQQILYNFPFSPPLSENEITQRIIVPCLQTISMRNAYKFRGLHFTGGRDEQGTDVEYYEMIGPDSFRHYTGIQVKKTNISVSSARELINQGNRAFEKEIIDPADGRSYRIHRWIVATTGTISSDAKRQIRTELARYGKPISFWDGVRVGEYILENLYSEFVGILQVPPVFAGQGSAGTISWDADDPPILIANFTATDWSSIDISPGAPPGLANGILLSAKPVGDSLPAVKLAVRSSTDEILMDSFVSRVNPLLLRLGEGDTHMEAMVVEGDRPIDILANGYLEFR